MSDLVARLRRVVPYQGKSKVAFLCHEAADELERLARLPEQEQLAARIPDDETLPTKNDQAYQVIGTLLSNLGVFESKEGTRALDYFCEDIYDPEFLPWPREALAVAPQPAAEETPSGHKRGCSYHVDQYDWECDCGLHGTKPRNTPAPESAPDEAVERAWRAWLDNPKSDLHAVGYERSAFNAGYRAALAAGGADRKAIIEECARKATSFLVGDPKNDIPLRSPTPHEIAAAIRALSDNGGAGE